MSTLSDLHDAIGGRLSSASVARHAAQTLGPVVTDSRQVEQGDVFWALRGPHHNASDFTEEAFRRGAIGAVVNKSVEVPEGRWAVCVDDTQDALLSWATWKRRRFTGTLIAVTGSVGKTTTRQMIHTILRMRLKGTASPRNYNNHIGVPLSMTAIESDHDYAILELGASRLGEIASLAELCAPKVGVITQVGDAHLGGFGSRQAIAEAKAELLSALPVDGRAVLGDDPWLRSIAQGCQADLTWVGTDGQCDLLATEVKSNHGYLSFWIAPRTDERSGADCKFCIPVWGSHHVRSALAAVAVGRMMGFDFEEMADALEDFEPVPMRCDVREIRGATIINDTYNSSPIAMRAALELIRDFDTVGRRIVVAGDMAELGDEAAAMHWQMGKQVVALGQAELLIACGQFARHMVAGARAAGMPRARAIPCEAVDDALPYLGQAIQPGDVVLVKGARVMGMERVVDALDKYPRRRTA